MKFAIIGAGNMGGAIARGLVAQKICAAEEIVCTAKSEKTRQKIAAQVAGIRVDENNARAATEAEIVIVAVKPWLVESVMEEMRAALSAGTKILVSVAAGISLSRLRELAGTPAIPIFVAIPNTAISVAQSMTFIAEDGATDAARERVVGIFSKLGKAVVVPEKQLAAGTAVASCGIAFAMRYVRAATEGGVELGLRAEDACAAVLQTLKGAAELLATSGEHPESAIDKVTTPGGLTIRGLNRMEERGFSDAVIQGLRACR